MTIPSRAHAAVHLTQLLLGLAMLLGAVWRRATRVRTGSGPKAIGRTAQAGICLFCTGDQARANPDFLAVVNFDEASADYGKVIARAPPA